MTVLYYHLKNCRKMFYLLIVSLKFCECIELPENWGW